MENNSNEFYKEKYFQQIDERFNSLDSKMDDLFKQMSDLKTKVTWIYAWSAGVGAAGAFIVNVIIK
jgi:hypothetical protein